MRQGGVVFENSVCIVLLESGNFAANRVQPVVFGIESCSALEKRLRIGNITGGNFGLRGGKL